MGIFFIRDISQNSNIVFIVLFIFLTLALYNYAYSKDIYRWVDENGNVYYSNTEAGVPEEYKNETNSLKFNDDINILGGDDYGSVEDYPGARSDEEAARNGVYKIKFNAFEGNARRIIVPVTFNSSVTAQLALDTGSPGLIISSDLARKLGLYENDSGLLMSFARGIGGQAMVMRTIIDRIQIGEATETFVPAMIADSISSAFEGLIGMDFMSKYSISIDNVNHYIVLKPNVDNSNYPAGHNRSWWQNTFREFRAYQDEWKKLSGMIGDWESKSIINIDMTNNDIKKLKDLADWQYLESSKLLNRLESYARTHDVPQDWRR